MKKLLRYGDCFVLLAAIFGCLLQLWFQNAGVDSKGLHDPTHPSWMLLCLLSAGTVVFLWFLTRTAGDNQTYQDNFHPSLVGTGTYLLLAIVLGYNGIHSMLEATGFLETLTAMACMLSAIMLAVTGIERFGGHQPAMFLHLFPCGYFALRVFLLGQELGTEPEICTFLFGFLAALCMIPAFYHLWTFDMNQANRQRSLFWSLTAAYFSLVTAFEASEHWVLYMAFGAFLLSNMCLLKPLAAPKATEDDAASPAEADCEEAAADAVSPVAVVFPAEDVPMEAPAPAVQPTPMTAGIPQEKEDIFIIPPMTPKPKATMRTDIDPDADMDAFLADLRQFLEADDSSF